MTIEELEAIAKDKEAYGTDEFLKALAAYWEENRDDKSGMKFKRGIALTEKYRRELFIVLSSFAESVMIHRAKRPLSYR